MTGFLISSLVLKISHSNETTMTSHVVHSKFTNWNVAFIFNTIKRHDLKLDMWITNYNEYNDTVLVLWLA